MVIQINMTNHDIYCDAIKSLQTLDQFIIYIIFKRNVLDLTQLFSDHIFHHISVVSNLDTIWVSYYMVQYTQ